MMKKIDASPGLPDDKEGLFAVALASAPPEIAAKLRSTWESPDVARTPPPDAQVVNDYVRTTCGFTVDVNRFRSTTICATIRSGGR